MRVPAEFAERVPAEFAEAAESANPQSAINTMRFLSLLCLFFFACTEQAPRPGLTDAQLARIMADLYVAEAATSGAIGYARDSLMQVYFNQVFEVHGVRREVYEKDIQLLATDVPHFEAVSQAARALLAPDSTKTK